MSDPVKADAGALAALRDKAVALREAIAACQPFKFTLTPEVGGVSFLTDEQAVVWHAYGALAFACTPEVILALVQDAERYRFLRDNPLQLRAIDGRASLGGWLKMGSANFDESVDVAMQQARMEAMETDHA